MNLEAQEKLSKAKTRLIKNHPFFAHIVFSLPMIEADIPTMATDMLNIYYGPQFVLDHSINELMGVICHEGMHVAGMHGLRKGTRDHKLWNIACDYAINPVVIDAGLQLPSNALYDEKYLNMTANQIYEDLMKNAIKITISFGGGEGDPKDGEDGDTPMWGGFDQPKDGNGNPLSKAQISEIEQEIRIKVTEAANTAKARGKLPASLNGLIEAVGQAKIDWKDYIQQWASGVIPDDYTWQRPNRSMMANYGIYMPRMKVNGAGHGVLSLDTSGSVSDAELIKYVTEIVGVIELCNPESLTIIQHDSVVHGITQWEAGEEFKRLKITGRGGTCIQPSFKAISELDQLPDWVIIFSDMEIGDWPAPQHWPDCPVLLCGTGPDTSPPGTNATYIDLRDKMENV